jgi:hypothetical protein
MTPGKPLIIESENTNELGPTPRSLKCVPTLQGLSVKGALTVPFTGFVSLANS